MFRGVGDKNPRWKGGIQKSSGYILLLMPDYPRATKRGLVPEHIFIAEKALGKTLPDKAEVHHLNGIRDDNRKENLIVCQDRAFHLLLHTRQRAIEATGNPKLRHCSECGQWLPLGDFGHKNDGRERTNRCKPCVKKVSFEWRNKDRESYNASVREKRKNNKEHFKKLDADRYQRRKMEKISILTAV